jgi:hypothetical protein
MHFLATQQVRFGRLAFGLVPAQSLAACLLQPAALLRHEVLRASRGPGPGAGAGLVRRALALEGGARGAFCAAARA